MDEGLETDTKIALERIDSFVRRVTDLIARIRAGERIPAVEEITEEEAGDLDIYLRDLARRLYGRTPAEAVWEPPYGKAVTVSANILMRARSLAELRAHRARDPTAVLRARLAALNESRAFFFSFLSGRSARAAKSSDESGTPVDRWLRALKNKRARAVLTAASAIITTIVAAVIALGGFTDYLSKFKEFSRSVYEDVRGRSHEPWYFGLGNDSASFWRTIWIRERTGEWTERYPDGRPSWTYQQTVREKVNGCVGSVLARTGEFGPEVFIPDVGCSWMQVLARPPGTTTWLNRPQGKMTDWGTSQSTAARMAAEPMKDVTLWGPSVPAARSRGADESASCATQGGNAEPLTGRPSCADSFCVPLPASIGTVTWVIPMAKDAEGGEQQCVGPNADCTGGLGRFLSSPEIYADKICGHFQNLSNDRAHWPGFHVSYIQK